VIDHRVTAVEAADELLKKLREAIDSNSEIDRGGDATGIASRKSISDKPTPETVPQSLSSKLSKTLPSNSSSICRSFLLIFDR
jgi:hypothetical protein